MDIMDTTINPASGGTAGVQPRGRISPIETAITDHLAYPWPGNRHPPAVPAGPLIERITAEVLDLTGMAPSAKAISAALLAAPRVAKSKSSSLFYSGVTLETRAERARAEVIGDPFGGLVHDEFERRFGEHVDKHHNGRRHACGHPLPGTIWDDVSAAVDADPDRIDQLVEQRFGPYLRGEVEDDPPVVNPFLAAMLALAPDPDPEPDAPEDEDDW